MLKEQYIFTFFFYKTNDFVVWDKARPKYAVIVTYRNFKLAQTMRAICLRYVGVRRANERTIVLDKIFFPLTLKMK